MSAAIRMRDDYSADELRGLARTCQNGAQARRLMSLAAVEKANHVLTRRRYRIDGSPDLERLGYPLQR